MIQWLRLRASKARGVVQLLNRGEIGSHKSLGQINKAIKKSHRAP